MKRLPEAEWLQVDDRDEMSQEDIVARRVVRVGLAVFLLCVVAGVLAR